MLYVYSCHILIILGVCIFTLSSSSVLLNLVVLKLGNLRVLYKNAYSVSLCVQNLK